MQRKENILPNFKNKGCFSSCFFFAAGRDENGLKENRITSNLHSGIAMTMGDCFRHETAMAWNITRSNGLTCRLSHSENEQSDFRQLMTHIRFVCFVSTADLATTKHLWLGKKKKKKSYKADGLEEEVQFQCKPYIGIKRMSSNWDICSTWERTSSWNSKKASCDIQCHERHRCPVRERVYEEGREAAYYRI